MKGSNAKLSTHCFIPNLSNNSWNIRRRDDRPSNPAFQRIILEIDWFFKKGSKKSFKCHFRMSPYFTRYKVFGLSVNEVHFALFKSYLASLLLPQWEQIVYNVTWKFFYFIFIKIHFFGILKTNLWIFYWIMCEFCQLWPKNTVQTIPFSQYIWSSYSYDFYRLF